MTTPPDYDAARRYGSAILDAVSAFRVDDERETMNLAAQRALEVQAIKVETSDDGDAPGVDIDMSPAIAGTLILVQALLTTLHEATGEDPDVILANARERFDSVCTAE